MKKQIRQVIILMLILVLAATSLSWAAAVPVQAPTAVPVAAPATLQKARLSQSPEKVRLVLEMTAVPAYKVVFEQEPLRLVLDMPATLGKGILPQFGLNDPFVNSVQILQNGPGQVRVIVNLKMAVNPKVTVLASPNRLVVDLLKLYEHKEQEIRPGFKYTSLLRGTPAGPVQSYILEVDPSAGFRLKPILSNGAVAGLETVKAMSARVKAAAAVNGSYFAPNGEIIGLLKLDGQIVSTPTLTRTAFGVMPDGRIIIGRVAYDGRVTLPDGRTVVIAGVNRERGANELILYNAYYASSTGSNAYGIEYLLDKDSRVTAIVPSNSRISPDGTVLSAHGTAAQALVDLKVGDVVGIAQTLGPDWDQTVDALGAGPTLVKDGDIFLTTKPEEFASDVAGGRAPRTALGVTKDGRLLLVVVDGRRTASIGLTLLDLAQFMRELGAVDAMNLDGGGSSELVLGDRVINKPSDGRERKVGDALAIVPASLAN